MNDILAKPTNILCNIRETVLTDLRMQRIICLTHLRKINCENKVIGETQCKQQEQLGLTYFVKLMETEGDAHHDDGEGTIVSPSVACWT